MRRERVFRHLGVEYSVEENPRGGAGLTLDEALRRREERDNTVEIAIRLVGCNSGARGTGKPFRGESAAVPGQPEQFLDGRTI